MTGGTDRFDELRALLDALCEESITAGQEARLEELVLADPEAEAYYIRYLHVHSELLHEFGGAPAALDESLRGPEPAAATPASLAGREAPRRVRFPGVRARRLRWPALAATAAAIVLVSLLTRPKESHPLAEATDENVAVLVQAVGADWEETGLPTRAGSPLPAGRLRLNSGLAWIEFYSGATVILEGPADFELLSTSRAYCHRGKLRAHVPPQAHGFTVESPRLELVDRGTEFGIQVGETGRTEVHVFEGAVELYETRAGRTAPSSQRLTTGKGLRVDEAGGFSPTPADPKTFVSSEELAARSEAEAREQQRRWRESSAALRREPSLLAYYTFEEDRPWDLKLRDQSGGRVDPRDGVVIGCRRGDGRWPGKGALEFRRPSDRVRINVPGEFDSLTLAAWVRIDGLDNRYNSLMLTDGFDQGEVHWQVREDGTLQLGVQGPEVKSYVNYRTRVLFPPQALGQWSHLAVVHDRAAGAVSHYVNGRRVSRHKIKLDGPLRIGDAEIGNWNPDSFQDKRPVRNLNGAIDEFLIFARALDGPEIERLYSEGQPHP
jgi:hypothetical protein